MARWEKILKLGVREKNEKKGKEIRSKITLKKEEKA